jgi:spore coat polysaccharide biosynthesis protein SpsF
MQKSNIKYVKNAIYCFIQARQNSTRLKEKLFHKINGLSILEHVFNRVAKSNIKRENIIIVTGRKKKNIKIINFCVKKNINFFTGSEKNLVDRFYKAKNFYKSKIVCTVTGDCILTDYKIINKCISNFKKMKLDYLSTSPSYSYPEGFGVEIFSSDCLDKIKKLPSSNFENEHISLALKKNIKKFKVFFLEKKKLTKLSDIKFSIDNKNDLIFIKKIFKKFYKKDNFFGLNSILKKKKIIYNIYKKRDPFNFGMYKNLFSLKNIKINNKNLSFKKFNDIKNFNTIVMSRYLKDGLNSIFYYLKISDLIKCEGNLCNPIIKSTNLDLKKIFLNLNKNYFFLNKKYYFSRNHAIKDLNYILITLFKILKNEKIKKN